jgi:hypothetical protein
MKAQADEFLGLTPSVDARRAGKIFALSGRNFVLDSQGPRSVFGNRFVTPYPLGAPAWSQGMRLRLRSGDRAFTFTSDSIIEWNESDGGWRILYYFDDISAHPYAWTGDYLSGIMYFCHPAIGILSYVIDSDVCLPLTGPGVPSEPIALCECSGRLVVIDEKLISWSGPGDGTDWIPQLGGAGFQLINARVPGYPLMINSYSRGVLVWTTGGVLRSEFTGDQAVFRHKALVTEYRPINSYCTFRLDNDTIGFLDARGIFSSKGESPQPLTPLFNEFLIDYLQRNNLNVGNNVRVEFDALTRRLYVSISLSETNPLFEKTFVLYTPLDKWGSFDEEHYGILPVRIQDSSRADDYFGFVDWTGRVRYWNMGGTREVLPDSGLLNSYYPLIQKPAVRQLDGDAVVLSSSGSVNTIETTPYTQRAGYYNVVGTSPTTSNVEGLDSVVRLGLIRANNEISYDRLLEVNQIYIGSIMSNPFETQVLDYAEVPEGVEDEDYNAAIGAEDLGLLDPTYVNHGIRLVGTVDGQSVWDSCVPILISYDKASREFSGSVVGLFHIVELSATEPGEAYHVKSLELNGVDAGRLN